MPYAFQILNFFTIEQILDFLLRILVACVCGTLIGYERSLRFKEAGVRTHLIVCCASAMIMIVSKYGFVDLTDSSGELLSGLRGADPARIAAQVISGVGFLGAGAIFRNKNIVKGLTTAAGLWATAGIGLAIGSGMYFIGIFVALIVALFQVIMHKFTIASDSFSNNFLEFIVDNNVKFQQILSEFVKVNNGKLTSYSISKSDDLHTHYSVTIKTKRLITMEQLHEFLEEHEGIRSASTSFL